MKIYVGLLLIVLSECVFRDPNKKYFYLDFLKIHPKYEGINNRFEVFPYNYIGTGMSIGSPSHGFYLCLQMDSYATWVNVHPKEVTKLDFRKFHTTNSPSYVELKEKYISENQEFYMAAPSEDIVIVDEVRLNKYKFMASYQNNVEPVCGGVFGLNYDYQGNEDVKEMGLIQQYKNAGLLNSAVFSIRYTRYDSGQLIVGEYPHNLTTLYKLSNFVSTPVVDINNRKVWGLRFDSITYDNVEIPHSGYEAQIKLEYGLIQAPKEFNWQIEKRFFEHYLYYGRCQKMQLPTGEIGISCNMDIDISNFPEIIFYHKELDYVFKLDSSNLFYESIGRKWFLMVFNYESSHWVLGAPFIRKYEMLFDQEKKIIGLYKDKSFRYGLSLLVMVFLSILVFGGLTFIITSKITKPRKKRAIELDDKYEYLPMS